LFVTPAAKRSCHCRNCCLFGGLQIEKGGANIAVDPAAQIVGVPSPPPQLRFGLLDVGADASTEINRNSDLGGHTERSMRLSDVLTDVAVPVGMLP
jgi:hypothetical protein